MPQVVLSKGAPMKSSLRLAILFSLLIGYSVQASAVSEEVMKRVQADLGGQCLEMFLKESFWGGAPTGYQTVRVRTVFAISGQDSQQSCGWAWTGIWKDWEPAEQAAIASCNSAKPSGAPPCEIYAHNNDIVYVSVHEKLNTAKRFIEAGDFMKGESALREVSEKSLSNLTMTEKGEYEYLSGKVLNSSDQLKDKADAIDHFNKAWSSFNNVAGAVAEGDLRLSLGITANNSQRIRSAYQYFLANASTEQKALHPEAEQNLKQAESYYQADLAQKEEAAKEQTRLKEIETEGLARQQAALEEKRLEQEKIDAPRKKREAEQLARQERLAAIKAEHEAKEEEKARLADEKREAKRVAEQQRRDEFTADRKAKQLEKARLTEEKRIAREGDGSADDRTCKSYGSKPGTQGYITCRIQLTERKQAEDVQRSAQARVEEEKRAAELRAEDGRRAAQAVASEAAMKKALTDFSRFKKCAEETKNPVCYNNAGVAAQDAGNIVVAKTWYTEAARYGEPNAIANLTRLGAPIPETDLLRQQRAAKQQNQAAQSNDGLLEALGVAAFGYHLGRSIQPPPPPKTLNCAGFINPGGFVTSTCQ